MAYAHIVIACRFWFGSVLLYCVCVWCSIWYVVPCIDEAAAKEEEEEERGGKNQQTLTEYSDCVLLYYTIYMRMAYLFGVHIIIIMPYNVRSKSKTSFGSVHMDGNAVVVAVAAVAVATEQQQAAA